MSILVTGCAGFIGFHTSKYLLEMGEKVIGIDNLNDFYDVNLKKNRLKILKKLSLENKKKAAFKFYKLNLEDKKKLHKCFEENKIKIVINLAAQAGVRHSLKNPDDYVKSNIIGFLNILEISKDTKIEHLVYASTSSVYGALPPPFKETIPADHPIQFYAVTKRANELMAHSYSHLYDLPTTGLRFFTVYGPWGRPDMALFKFVKSILDDKPIQIFNNGNHSRSFTYIDDIVDGIIKITSKKAEPDPSWNINLYTDNSSAPFRIFNIGNDKTVDLMDFIEEIEKQLGKKAKKKFMPLQKGDVKTTIADISKIKKFIEYQPKTDYKEGIKEFINWYLEFYK